MIGAKNGIRRQLEQDDGKGMTDTRGSHRFGNFLMRLAVLCGCWAKIDAICIHMEPAYPVKSTLDITCTVYNAPGMQFLIDPLIDDVPENRIRFVFPNVAGDTITRNFNSVKFDAELLVKDNTIPDEALANYVATLRITPASYMEGRNVTCSNLFNAVSEEVTIVIAIARPPDSDANLEWLSEDGRVAVYSCDSALYELDGTSSIGYDEESGWPNAPKCKAVGWIVFLIFLVLLLTLVVVVLVAALICIIIALKRKNGACTVSLGGTTEMVDMKENMSYDPVKIRSQTPAEGPVYEDADITQPPGEVHTGGNVAYGHIRS